MANESPKISIIVPIYNTGEYLAECLDSILHQTFRDYEVICIDDGSPDKSYLTAQKYAEKDGRIRIIRQENQGVVSARNNAIKIARGEYIFPLDSDDKIAPTALEKLYEIMATKKYQAVCPLGFLFGKENRPWMLPKPSRWNMYSRKNGLHNSTIYPKSLWEKYGGYDEQFEDGKEDFDFFLNFIDDHQPVCQTKERLFYYRVKSPEKSRDKNVSRNKNIKKKLNRLLFKKRPIMMWYYGLRKILNVPKNIIRFFFCVSLSKNAEIWSICIFKIPVISWPNAIENINN
ncbi:MAG: glycosyltransferase [Rickettsiales bacterium]|jgi:glycosyltransferase involved in cell wall biosynthesis|nr:glycosyltransferase [Rickettsiales bacterium]